MSSLQPVQTSGYLVSAEVGGPVIHHLAFERGEGSAVAGQWRPRFTPRRAGGGNALSRACRPTPCFPIAAGMCTYMVILRSPCREE